MSDHGASRRRRSSARALLISGCLAAASLWGCSSEGHDAHEEAATTPGAASAEAGFAWDMSFHHSQAVAMAVVIGERTTDDDLRVLAMDIALGQQHQIGRMSGWLDEWGLTISSPNPPMSWLSAPLIDDDTTSMPGHDMGSMDMGDGAAMPGMEMPGTVTRPQINALGTLPLADAEISFLQLMIGHHLGGIEMANDVLARTTRADVVALATNIVASQQAEINAMTEMLSARGATP